MEPASHVVIYDDKQGGNAAARFWWMLKAVGHNNVQVLNGGLQSAKAAGYPMSSGIVSPIPSSPYPAKEWKLPTVDLDEAKVASKQSREIIVDVRFRRTLCGNYRTHRFDRRPYSGCS
ncbi:MAG: rhodanese-like domain-containing protein [Cytophagales bacterium]|nr:rhodanese-like domain-containing protein [Cytophagales bacterium]